MPPSFFILAQSQPAQPTRGWFDWLFSLRTLSGSAEGVELQFANAIPAWAAILIAAALAVAAFWSYAKLDVPTRWRRVLAVLRWCSLLVLALLVAMPQLVRPNERVEKDVVLVMVDRSASMLVPDAGTTGATTTRDQQAASLLDALAPSLKDLAANRRVALRGFGASSFELPIAPAQTGKTGLSPKLDAPTAQRTNLAASLSQGLQSLAGDPLAGIIVLSDGRSSDVPSAALLEQLKERAAPILAIPLGSEIATPDLALTNVASPSAAFVGDIVPVQAVVELLGASEETLLSGVALSGTVELLDASGAVLDSIDLNAMTPASGSRARPTTSAAGNPAVAVTLASRALLEGRQVWSLRLTPKGPDLSASNNSQAITVDLAPSTMRVAYFDGYPRWEYRYLKNLLVREAGVQSTVTLLSADRRSIQEGNVPLDSMPITASDWSRFDVVILGDLRPGLFTPEQLTGLRSAISERGVGLLWIAGPAFTPTAWAGTALGDVLPISLGDSASSSQSVPLYAGPVLLAPGPAAPALGVMQLGDTAGDAWPSVLQDKTLNWNQLRWAQRIDASMLKPAAEALALARPLDEDARAATPLFITMRYGSGRIVYAGTDETWRFRYARGETLTERIWVPLVRLLAKGSFARLGKPATLEASPTQALANQPVRVTVRVLDQTLLDANPQSVNVQLRENADDISQTNAPATTLTLLPSTSRLSQLGEPITFSSTFVPEQPGLVRITSNDPLLADLALEARVEVSLPEDELRRPQADHALLASLAAHTSGRVLTPSDILAGKVQLADLLPNRERRTLTTPDIETLWDKPFPWIVLISLLAAEWLIRRLVRLS